METKLTIEISKDMQEIAKTIDELGWEISAYDVIKATREELKRAAELTRKRRILVEALGSMIANQINNLPF